MITENLKKITTIDGHLITLQIFNSSHDNNNESKADGVILAVHGLSEYADRYRQLAEISCKKNKIFVSFNLRGHGNNAVKKGDTQNLQCLILDIIFVFNTLKTLFPKISSNSFAIFGHSLGGLLTTYAASILKQEVKNVFLSAPGYSSRQKIPNWKIFIANKAANFLPEMPLPLDLDYSNISNNPRNNEEYKNDPLILKQITVRFGKAILEGLIESNIKTALNNITADVTYLLPNDDNIVDTNITKQFLTHCKLNYIIHEIHGAGHESFFEQENIQKIAISHYEKWLEKI